MSTLKTKINADTVLAFLQSHYDKDIPSLDSIHGGELSQGFFFHSKGEDYVIRINTILEYFKKDAYAYTHFHSQSLPIPEMITLGTLNDEFFYAITKRAPGEIFAHFKGDALQKVLPSFLEALDTIRTINVKNTKGYGYLNTSGQGKYSSWRDSILSVTNTKNYGLEKTFTDTFFEKEFYDKSSKKLLELINFCPEEKFLVHGDFGVDNVICDENKVTGVFDWAYMSYGDFLYDIAYVDFWPSDMNFKEVFRKHANEIQLPLPHYEERLLCYQIYFCLLSLIFFAHSQQKGKYDFTKNRLDTLMSQ